MNNPKLNLIETKIYEGLNKFSKKIPRLKSPILGSDCTKEIKEIIGNLGHKMNFDVASSGNNKFEHEWLYDIIWYETNENGFSKLKLAVESELCRDLGQIKYDFDKLLVTNAELRIMICMSFANGEGISLIYEQCLNAVENYKLLPKGSRFLLLIWDDYISGEFKPYLIVK